MKVTMSKKLDPSLLGERVLREYSYRDSTGESNDGMRRGYTYTVHCKVFGTIENEVINQDGTYTYEYSSRIAKDAYGGGPRKPSESQYDLKEMVQELMFNYNIHEFSTDLQEEPNNIKDYYASIDANATYKKDKEPYFSYRWSIYSKDSKGYTETDNTLWSSYERIKSESIDDMNEQLNGAFSKDDYILYLIGKKIEKTYKMKFGLDEIGEDETVRDFLGRMNIEKPKYNSLQEAMQDGEITMEDFEVFLNNYKNISATQIPQSLLKTIFEKKPDFIEKFNESTVPSELLRTYKPDFDITKINPTDLKDTDLDAVLDKVIKSYVSDLTFKEELMQAYMQYFEGFYEKSEELKKIISALNTGYDYFFLSHAKEFVDKISPEIVSRDDVRDVLLNTEGIKLSQILNYDLRYDEYSAKKLMKILSNTTSKISLKDVNSVLNILQENGINNDEILQALRENGFNISISDWKEDQERISTFKSFGITGITLDDLRDSILKDKNFSFLKLADDISSEDITREYNSLLNELAEKKGKKDDKYTKRYEEIFELMCNYSSVSELFSRLTPEIKELTKKLIIESLDVIEELQRNPIGYSSEFPKIMKIMTQSFEISENDMTNIYMKCLNNGASKEDIIDDLKQYIPEEERKSFEERITKANIYPNPKYFWLTDRNLKRIPIDRGENRETIKSKIQSDGRCFSTKIKTDMVGESKDGKKIAVNNLSKWLFGVPGARGKLSITKAGDYIQLPENTPDEVMKLIIAILNEKTKDER